MIYTLMFSEDPCFGNFLQFNRYYNGNFTYPTLEDGMLVPAKLNAMLKTLGEACTVSVRWQAGDVLCSTTRA
tara:strand:- start:260 stop:475 length:216 start_codon:yes stop_codon:yes gene_type:complete